MLKLRISTSKRNALSHVAVLTRVRSMPYSSTPIIEWPSQLSYLLEGAQITSAPDGRRFCRIDVDIADPKLLFLLNDFEAHSRQNKVRLRLAGSDECIVGEMNPLLGMGAASDPTRGIGRVRISFHDMRADNCVDEAVRS
jgi:hypothetical protein